MTESNRIKVLSMNPGESPQVTWMREDDLDEYLDIHSAYAVKKEDGSYVAYPLESMSVYDDDGDNHVPDEPATSGVKHDHGKPMVSLVRPEFILGVAEVMTFGANKYGRFNYRHGMDHSRLMDAALRHLMADLAGERLDPESGLPHIMHAASNLNMLHDYRVNELGNDDL